MESWKLPPSCQILCLIALPGCCRLHFSLSPLLSSPTPPKSYVIANLPSSHLAGQIRCFITRDHPLGVGPYYTDTHTCLPRQLLKQLQSQTESIKTLQWPLFSKGRGVKNCNLVERQPLNPEEFPRAQTSCACVCSLRFGMSPCPCARAAADSLSCSQERSSSTQSQSLGHLDH